MKEKENIKSGYKKTPVGIIPEDWEVKKVFKVMEVLGGNAFKSSDAVQSGIKWLKIANVGKNEVKEDIIEYLPYSFENKYEKYLLNKGDFVMALTRPLLDNKLKVAKIKGETKWLLNQRVAKLNGKNKQITSYLISLLKQPFYCHQLEVLMAGTDPPNLSLSDFRELKLPIPPLPEQKAIADCLSTWDRAIEKQIQLIQSKKEFKKGLMQGLFNGKLTIKDDKIVKSKEGEDFTKDWEEVRLGEFFKESKIKSEINDKTKRISVRLHLEGIDKREVRGTEADSTQFYSRKAGQFIYGKQNFHNGALGIIPEEFDGFETTSDIPSFDINKKVNHQFIFYLLVRKDFYEKMENKTTGTGSKRLHPQEFLNTKVRIPGLNLQNSIAQVLQFADKEIELLEKKLEQLQLQKKGFMQVLLMGEKRLL